MLNCSRCNRNCYNCPICTAPLSVQSMEQSPALLNPDTNSQPIGPFFLSCPYCNWSSLEINIEFEKASNITGQLAKLKNHQKETIRHKASSSGQTEENRRDADSENITVELEKRSPAMLQVVLDEEVFSNMLNFYKTQQPSQSIFGSDVGFGSPSSLTRIMNLYTNAGAKRMRREKPQVTREALTFEEGLQELDLSEDDRIIDRLAKTAWEDLAGPEQNLQQIGISEARFVDELRPVPTLLRTKRLKRCRACRNVLFRPEAKIQSSRPKIRLLAMAYIPRISLAPLPDGSQSTTSSNTATPYAQLTRTSVFGTDELAPNVPIQFLLTIHNPLYDPMTVTLATPAVTPGKIASRVTVLCPQFKVGASTDVWDEALNGPGPGIGGVTGTTIVSIRERNKTGGNVNAAEAGKIWERGRNWTSIVVEVIPGSPPLNKQDDGTTKDNNKRTESDKGQDHESLSDDDYVLEVPIFIRFEYETDPAEEGGPSSRPLQVTLSVIGPPKGKPGAELPRKEKREGAFWSVLGIGTIRR